MLISGETARLRADSPESVLFAKNLILPLALKELNLFIFTWIAKLDV